MVPTMQRCRVRHGVILSVERYAARGKKVSSGSAAAAATDQPEADGEDVGSDGRHPEKPVEALDHGENDQQIRELAAGKCFEESPLRGRGLVADDGEVDGRHREEDASDEQ